MRHTGSYWSKLGVVPPDACTQLPGCGLHFPGSFAATHDHGTNLPPWNVRGRGWFPLMSLKGNCTPSASPFLPGGQAMGCHIQQTRAARGAEPQAGRGLGPGPWGRAAGGLAAGLHRETRPCPLGALPQQLGLLTTNHTHSPIQQQATQYNRDRGTVTLAEGQVRCLLPATDHRGASGQRCALHRNLAPVLTE